MKKTIGKEIDMMLSRFLNGETTLHEERRLTEFFTQNDVPEEYAEYKEMFTYFDNGMPLGKPKTRTLGAGRRLMAAAAVAIMMAVATVVYFNRMHIADRKTQTATAQQNKQHEEKLYNTTDIDMSVAEETDDAVDNSNMPNMMVATVKVDKGGGVAADRIPTTMSDAEIATTERNHASAETTPMTAENVETQTKNTINEELERYLQKIEKNSEVARNECRRELENMYAVRSAANAGNMIRTQMQLEKNGFIATRNDGGDVVIVDNNLKTVAI